MKKIIYEDEFVRVIFLRASIDSKLVITFTNMVNLAKGLSFYAEKPLAKYSSNVVSFMAKSPNWYPQDSMNKAIHAIGEIVDSFEYKIAYGGSMGGYAAIKYSNLLNVNRVVSLDPQFSINPHDIDDKTYVEYFNNENHSKMRIVKNDISSICDYYIMYDPFYPVDQKHIDKILSVNKNMNLIRIRFSAHSSTAITANSEFLKYLLFSKIDINDGVIYEKIRKIKRNNSFYYNNLIKKNLGKNPKRFFKIINEKNDIDFSFINEDTKDFIIKYAVMNGFFSNTLVNRVKKSSEFKAIYLKSVHKYVLVYDKLRNGLFNYPESSLSSSKHLIPVIYKEGLMSLKHGGVDYAICVKRTGEVFLSLENSHKNISDSSNLFLNSDIRGTFISSNGGIYLTPLKNGDCVLKSKKLDRWEYFQNFEYTHKEFLE